MARSGTFQGPAYIVGQPVGIAKPPDNKIPQYDQGLASATDLNAAQREALQTEVDNLYGALVQSRDYVGP